MKKKILLLGTTILITSIFGFGQMINGGFEHYSFVTNDPFDFSIDNAPGWHDLNPSCDLAHPLRPLREKNTPIHPAVRLSNPVYELITKNKSGNPFNT